MSQRFEWVNSSITAQINNPELQNLPYKVGEGSEFTLLLPDSSPERLCYVSTNRRSLEQETSPEQTTLSKPILMIEDDEPGARLLHNYLETIGYQVKHIKQLNSLDTVLSFKPDLILLNVQLQNSITRLDMLRSPRQEPEGQHLPVVIVT